MSTAQNGKYTSERGATTPPSLSCGWSHLQTFGGKGSSVKSQMIFGIHQSHQPTSFIVSSSFHDSSVTCGTFCQVSHQAECCLMGRPPTVRQCGDTDRAWRGGVEAKSVASLGTWSITGSDPSGREPNRQRPAGAFRSPAVLTTCWLHREPVHLLGFKLFQQNNKLHEMKLFFYVRNCKFYLILIF